MIEAPQRVFLLLTAAEVRFLDAAVERLIPTDELGPGARDADVTVYIDRQLAGSWGVHGRQYRLGPWKDGAPEQGYQSRLTPQELYRQAIREVNEHCLALHQRKFDQLPDSVQDEVLKSLESGAVTLPSVSSKLFFDLLWRNTEEGFFADPIYGGNKDKVGWKLLGFPGMPSGQYREWATSHAPYHAEPVSIRDVQEGRVAVDAQGFAKHIMLKQETR